MIDVNLHPGAKRRRRKSRKRSRSLSLPSLANLPSFDRLLAFVVVAWIVGPAVIAWLVLGARARQAELRVEIEEAAQDSARYAQIIQATRRLQSQRDTIAEKLRIIQEIDAERYIWTHIMDEVARAVPDYTWISELVQTASGPVPRFRVAGYTATTFALTRFMTDLEASPFIRGVQLASSELVGHQGELVYRFSFQAGYEEPPPDVLDISPFIILEDSSGVAPD